MLDPRRNISLSLPKPEEDDRVRDERSSADGRESHISKCILTGKGHSPVLTFKDPSQGSVSGATPSSLYSSPHLVNSAIKGRLASDLAEDSQVIYCLMIHHHYYLLSRQEFPCMSLHVHSPKCDIIRRVNRPAGKM